MNSRYNNTGSTDIKTVEVTGDTNPDEALSEAQQEEAKELRTNSYRKRSLEDYAKLLSNSTLTLKIDESLPTAYIDMSRTPWHIAVTGREIEQPATAYERPVYDSIAQKGLTVHEVGHALYTDHNAKMKRLNQIEPFLQPIAHQLWNIFEDGAIEEAMRETFSDRITFLLAVLNMNLRGATKEDYTDSIADLPPHIRDQLSDDELEALEEEIENQFGGPREIDFFGAVCKAAMDLTVWDGGDTNDLLTGANPNLLFKDEETREHFNDWLPRISETSQKVLSTGDPVRRTNIIFDFWDDLQEFMEDEDMIPDPEDLPQQPGGKPDDSDGQMGQGQSAPGLDANSGDDMGQRIEQVINESGSSGSPNQPDPELDTDDNNSGSGAGDEESGDEDGDDESGAGGDGDEEGSDEDGDDEGGAGGDGDEEDDESSTGSDSEGGDEDGDTSTNGTDGDDDGPAPSENAPESEGMSPEENGAIEEDIRQGILREKEEAQNVDDQLKNEMGEFAEVMSGSRDSGDDPLEGIEFQLHRETGEDNNWAQAKRDGQRLANILNEVLRKESRNRRVRRQNAGDPNANDIPSLVTEGNTRIFDNIVQGEQKDYSCIVVLDRSGSMSHKDIQVAQRAVGAFMHALDEVGIDNSLMDMYRNTARVISPFGQDARRAHAGIYSDESGGGTPLSDMLYAARRRLERRGGNPFVIVITDGHPNDNDEYMRQLHKCHMPVLGILLNLGQNPDSVPDWMEEQQRNYHRSDMVFDEDDLQQTLQRLAWTVMF